MQEGWTEKPGEVEEDARIVEDAGRGPVVAPEPPTVKTVFVSEPEPSNTTLEPEVASELVKRPDEVTLEDAEVVELAVEGPTVPPEPPSVEITPVSKLDPTITALEPGLAIELDRRAADVILEAAAGESPVAQPSNTRSQLSDEALHGANPAATARGPGPPDVEVADHGEVCMRTFPAVASSVAGARGFAVQALAEIPADVVEDIRLMVSELASNAIEHAMTRFHLAIHRSRHEIRVEVTDSGGGTPAMRTPGSDAVNGRGLQIVNTVSTHWGVEQESEAKTVWFTRAFAPMASPAPLA
jgi:anti-sigma regulatory factor (Ser/Thr protein kinase)